MLSNLMQTILFLVVLKDDVIVYSSKAEILFTAIVNMLRLYLIKEPLCYFTGVH